MIEFLILGLLVVQIARFVVEFTVARAQFRSDEQMERQLQLMQRGVQSQEEVVKTQEKMAAQAAKNRAGKTVYTRKEDGTTEASHMPPTEN